MPQPLTAPMPADLELTGGYTVQIVALNPTTGAVVPGVNISAFVMQVLNAGGGSLGDLAVGDFQLVPGPGA